MCQWCLLLNKNSGRVNEFAHLPVCRLGETGMFSAHHTYCIFAILYNSIPKAIMEAFHTISPSSLNLFLTASETFHNTLPSFFLFESMFALTGQYRNVSVHNVLSCGSSTALMQACMFLAFIRAVTYMEAGVCHSNNYVNQ